MKNHLVAKCEATLSRAPGLIDASESSRRLPPRTSGDGTAAEHSAAFPPCQGWGGALIIMSVSASPLKFNHISNVWLTALILLPYPSYM